MTRSGADGRGARARRRKRSLSAMEPEEAALEWIRLMAPWLLVIGNWRLRRTEGTEEAVLRGPVCGPKGDFACPLSGCLNPPEQHTADEARLVEELEVPLPVVRLLAGAIAGEGGPVREAMLAALIRDDLPFSDAP